MVINPGSFAPRPGMEERGEDAGNRGERTLEEMQGLIWCGSAGVWSVRGAEPAELSRGGQY